MMGDNFVHFYPFAAQDRLSGTKEESLALLFDDIFAFVRNNRGRILWRVLPEVEHQTGYDPKVSGWRAFARFSIEVGIDGEGVLRENDISKYPSPSFLGIAPEVVSKVG